MNVSEAKAPDRKDLTGPALRTFFRIAEAWGLKGLHILLPKTADEWVRKPNKARVFGGASALDRMMSGNVADLYVVRQYVDGQRG